MRSGGGLGSILYSWRKARQSGGVVRFYRRMRLRNACKTCALGMGGQRGGMRNETGTGLEVCKKSIQAQAADMQPPIPPDFFAAHSHAELCRWDHAQLEDAGRIAFPLLYEEGTSHWRRIPWSEALDRAAAALRATPPAQALFYSSGRSSNEAAFLLQCFARVYGTNNVNNCSYYCHQASGVGLGLAIGSGTATITHEDLEHADFALVLGANPASNHPRLISRLVDIRRRGGTVVVVNPFREAGLVRFRIPSRPASLLFGTRVSDLYVQPHIGGDVAFLKGVAKAVVEAGGIEREYIERFTAGTRPWSATCGRRLGRSWNIRAACRWPPCSGPPSSTCGPTAPFSSGRWESRSTCTASTTCWPSRTWRFCAAWSASRTQGCCPSAGTPTCRA
jgi:anaerobic selenocysteine-containing dehydrogenase